MEIYLMTKYGNDARSLLCPLFFIKGVHIQKKTFQQWSILNHKPRDRHLKAKWCPK